MSQTIERQVEQRLRDAEVRFTSGRKAVVGHLASAPGPKSAAELADELDGRIPLSSIYRTLAVLDDAGVITHHLGAKGLARYELAEWLTGHHHHLVCLNCGSISDVELAGERERHVEHLVAEIAGVVGFVPTDHSLEIEGRCSRCA